MLQRIMCVSFRIYFKQSINIVFAQKFVLQASRIPFPTTSYIQTSLRINTNPTLSHIPAIATLKCPNLKRIFKNSSIILPNFNTSTSECQYNNVPEIIGLSLQFQENQFHVNLDDFDFEFRFLTSNKTTENYENFVVASQWFQMADLPGL